MRRGRQSTAGSREDAVRAERHGQRNERSTPVTNTCNTTRETLCCTCRSGRRRSEGGEKWEEGVMREEGGGRREEEPWCGKCKRFLFRVAAFCVDVLLKRFCVNSLFTHTFRFQGFIQYSTTHPFSACHRSIALTARPDPPCSTKRAHSRQLCVVSRRYPKQNTEVSDEIRGPRQRREQMTWRGSSEGREGGRGGQGLSLIHISEPTRPRLI
eukprot:3935563-Rhodomonas_salina.1